MTDHSNCTCQEEQAAHRTPSGTLLQLTELEEWQREMGAIGAPPLLGQEPLVLPHRVGEVHW